MRSFLITRFLLIFLNALPARSQESTNSTFLLYKNSPFYHCSTIAVSPYGNFSTPLILHTFHTRDPATFCTTIGPSTTILPTALGVSAYLPSWPATLITLLSIFFSYLTTLRSLDPSGDKGGWTPNLMTLLPTTLFDTVRLFYWWILLFRSLRSPLGAFPWLSATLWILPAFYWHQLLAVRNAKWPTYLAASITILQLTASFAVVVAHWTHPDVGTWNYLPLDLPALGLPPKCQAGALPGDLFTDPQVRAARAIQTLQFIITAVGGVTRIEALSGRFPVLKRRHGLVVFWAMGMLISAVVEAGLAGWGGVGVRWTEGRCGVGIVVADGKWGYLDVEGGRAGRVVGAVLGVWG